MVQGEPAILGNAVPDEVAAPADRARPATRQSRGPTVRVSGGLRRLGASILDLVIIVPAALVLSYLASKLTGVRAEHQLDLLIDVLLITNPVVMMTLGMTLAVAAIYALVFQIILGSTPGMKLLGIKVIDVYGDRPAPARCVVRTFAGWLSALLPLLMLRALGYPTVSYLVGALILVGGVLWVFFDGEKRGLHDWIAGTYVIRN
jgi:uncharacterized RDD family membrane protein YckC